MVGSYRERSVERTFRPKSTRRMSNYGPNCTSYWELYFTYSLIRAVSHSVSSSEPYESDAHGPGHYLPPQRLRRRQLRPAGLVADRSGAGRHRDQRVHGAGHPAPPHRVWALPHGAGRPRPLPALQRPAAQRWLQPGPPGEESQLLPDAPGPVLVEQQRGWRCGADSVAPQWCRVGTTRILQQIHRRAPRHCSAAVLSELESFRFLLSTLHETVRVNRNKL